jgi:hypothetical protein
MRQDDVSDLSALLFEQAQILDGVASRSSSQQTGALQNSVVTTIAACLPRLYRCPGPARVLISFIRVVPPDKKFARLHRRVNKASSGVNVPWNLTGSPKRGNRYRGNPPEAQALLGLPVQCALCARRLAVPNDGHGSEAMTRRRLPGGSGKRKNLHGRGPNFSRL